MDVNKHEKQQFTVQDGQAGVQSRVGSKRVLLVPIRGDRILLRKGARLEKACGLDCCTYQRLPLGTGK